MRSVPTGAALHHPAHAPRPVRRGGLRDDGRHRGRRRPGPGGALGASGADGVRRYFRPGVNWAGRALYGVPVFGFALIQASQGAFSPGDGFVVVGLWCGSCAALLAEGVRVAGGASHPGGAHRGWDDPGVAPTLDRDCRRLPPPPRCWPSLFVAATVFMIGKP